MKKNILFSEIFLLLMLWATISFSQGITLKGQVKNDNNEPVQSVSVSVKDKNTGTYTDENGKFRLTTKDALPLTLIFSSIGYETREELISDVSDSILVKLIITSTLGKGVVISATRIPIRILESPVSIELLGLTSLRNNPSGSYYDLIGTLKGVDVTTSSLTYKTYSTRGFNISGSPRVNQLMEGMDNQSPGLNYPIGNFIGPTDLDVESVEVLPGASSALYGPGGMNGTILINSKNPFKYQGFSFIAQQGIMNIDKKHREKATGYNNFNFRWAKVLSERLAFKISGEYTNATDWLADDSSNYLRLGSTGYKIPGNRNTDPNYDGINVYGDETTVNIKDINSLIVNTATQQFISSYFQANGTNPSQTEIDDFLNTNPQTTLFYNGAKNNLVPDQKVSRTGYQEKDFINPKTWNLRLSGSVIYKFDNNLQLEFYGHYGTGNTVYTGNNRYAFRNIQMGQYKLELRNKNWFFRGYTTKEYPGEAYSATITAQFFNEAWKSSTDWYPQYLAAYLQAISGGASVANAHLAGRSFADIGRPLAGSSEFKKIFKEVSSVPIPNGGKLLEKSSLWMAEGQYNFTDIIKFAELIVGANQKLYVLNSEGTIFIDTLKRIKINETGIYAQLTKKFFTDRLSLSASGRYDKNENFKGKFTPRFTALVKIYKEQFIRLSYQTAYRFPTTSQQFIRLDVGDAVILGGLPWINDYMNVKVNPTFILDPATGQTVPYIYSTLKPEAMRSFELGYKALILNKLLVDAYAYFGTYTDFLGRLILIQPGVSSKPYSIVANSNTRVNTWGAGLGLEYRLPANFTTFFNIYTDELTNVPNGFMAYFNTPRYRVNAGFGNNGLGKIKKIGFNITFHWQDGFYNESEFAQANVKAFSTVDAQVNYKLLKIRSMIKLGATNIFNHYYQNASGNPYIGGLYYTSFSYNIL
jgi:outer membrane receptor protein involved in Fe transport